MELTGKIKAIGSVQTFGGDFTKRELVILTDDQYPQPISIEFLKDKTDLLNNLKTGDEVKVGINLRGREWTAPDGATRYFNSIVGWRIEKVGSNPKTESSKNINPLLQDDDSELPF